MESHISVVTEDCIGCGMCVEVCPALPGVFEMRDITAVVLHPETCERCMLCIDHCPTDAILMREAGETVFDLGDI